MLLVRLFPLVLTVSLSLRYANIVTTNHRYFARNRAELVQDSLMVRVAKPSEPVVRPAEPQQNRTERENEPDDDAVYSLPNKRGSYLDTAPSVGKKEGYLDLEPNEMMTTEKVVVRVDPEGESHIRPSALQYTEVGL